LSSLIFSRLRISFWPPNCDERLSAFLALCRINSPSTDKL